MAILKRRRGTAFLVLVLLIGFASWRERAPILATAARLWIVSDATGPADVAVVLGGGIEDRPFAAAAYYREGLVRRVLVAKAHEGPAEKLGVVLSNASVNYEILRKQGVPASDIEIFGDDLKSTREEALALRAWLEAAGVHSIIVPTEIFSARRVRWILDHTLDTGLSVKVIALDPPDYTCDDWWRDVQGLIAFQNEMIKYVYYRVKY